MEISKPDLIIKAAIDTFNTFGIRKTTLGDVASAAGISRSSIYVYFDNKEVLLRQSIEVLCQNEIDEFIRSLSVSEGSFTEILISALDQVHNKYYVERDLDLICELFRMEYPALVSVIREADRKMEQLIANKMEEIYGKNYFQSLKYSTTQLSRSIFQASKGMVFCFESLEEYREHRNMILDAFEVLIS